LELIRKARADLQRQLNLFLTLQAEISQIDRQIVDVLASVQDRRALQFGRFLNPERATTPCKQEFSGPSTCPSLPLRYSYRDKKRGSS
jgi:hypothetical protein